MRITFLYGAYPPIPDGGAGFLKNLAGSLHRFGIEVSVITSSRVASTYKEVQNDKVNVFPVIDDWELGIDNFKQLNTVLKETQPDIIHTIFPCSTFGNKYQLPMLAKLSTSKPLITTLYGFSFLRGNLRTRIAILTLLHISNRLISDSDFVIRIIKKYFPYLKRRLRYLPSGSNIPNIGMSYNDRLKLREQYSLDKNSFYVCHFGYLDWSRGIETLMCAVSLLRKRGCNLRVIMIGGNPYNSNRKYFEKLSHLITKLHLESYVVWTGFCNEQQIAHYFLCSDACALPFRRNTLGRSSLPAALSFSLPVITTSHSKTLYSLVDHDNVLLVPPDNVNKLAAAIFELINDHDLRVSLGHSAFNLWKAQFSWESISNKTVEIYREIYNG